MDSQRRIQLQFDQVRSRSTTLERVFNKDSSLVDSSEKITTITRETFNSTGFRRKFQ